MKRIPIPAALLAAVSDTSSFFIVSHINPDGDCVCSSLALASFLRRLGKKTVLVNPGPFTRAEIKEYEPLFKSRIDPDTRSSHPEAAVIVVDCSTIDRIGPVAEDITGNTVIVIDHHSSGEDFGDVRFINESAPAVSLMIQELIEELGFEPTSEESDLLFYAFSTDTGFFRHLGADSSLSFEYVSRMVAAGASPKAVYSRISRGKNILSKRHLGLLLDKMESYENDKIVLVLETAEETKRFGRENRESDAFYQQVLAIESVEIIALLREDEPGTVNGGLRSKKFVDVGAIAQEFGGGGHQRAAGFLAKESLSETKRLLLPLLIGALNSGCSSPPTG